MSADPAPAATVAPTTALTEMTTAPTLADIAAALQGYDPQSLTVASASAFLQQLVQPITGTETLPLRDALGRVLAGDVGMALDVISDIVLNPVFDAREIEVERGVISQARAAYAALQAGGFNESSEDGQALAAQLLAARVLSAD